MFTRQSERKATDNELIEAKQIYNYLKSIGLSALYAGGYRSKGHGFWVQGYGYKSCQACIVELGAK